MDFELWWLLPIPAVFFALGWIAARIDIKHLLRESRALPLSYFRGLNFLLNEQPDKAIESFIEVVKVDPQTDRSALRARQPVPAAGRNRSRDPDAPEPARPPGPAGRQAAGGGIRARAGLSPRRPARSRRGALHQARRLAVRARVARLPAVDLRAGKGLAQGDRRDAADGSARQAAVLQGDRPLLLRARAGSARSSHDFAAARSMSTRRSPNTGPARARRCCSATSTRSRDDLAAAIAAWQRIETQNPAFLALVADRLADAYRQDGQRRAGACACFAAYQQQYPSLDLLNAVFALTLAEEGAGRRGDAHQGRARAQSHAARPRPPARSAAACRARRAPPRPRARQAAASAQHIKRLGMYKCDHCGFRAKQYYWRCPGCGKWETYSPRRTETPDGYA